MTKTYLIAAGTTGMGAEIASRLRDAGHNILTTSRGDAGDLKFDATQSIGELALPDSLDGVVYCPGTITLKPFHRLTDEEFLQDFEINLLGASRLLRQAYPALKKSGNASVVLFSTVAVQTGLSFHASIASAKGAVEGLMRSLAAEWAPQIRVNCIAPSLTDTPLASSLLDSEDKREAASGRHPLKRVGDPRQFAEIAELLLSDSSQFITGQVLKADGGLSSVRPL